LANSAMSGPTPPSPTQSFTRSPSRPILQCAEYLIPVTKTHLYLTEEIEGMTAEEAALSVPCAMPTNPPDEPAHQLSFCSDRVDDAAGGKGADGARTADFPRAPIHPNLDKFCAKGELDAILELGAAGPDGASSILPWAPHATDKKVQGVKPSWRLGGGRRTVSAMRDDDWAVGWGCAATMYPTQLSPATARVTVTPQGTVKVQTAAPHIGTSAFTVVALAAVVVELRLGFAAGAGRRRIKHHRQRLQRRRQSVRTDRPGLRGGCRRSPAASSPARTQLPRIGRRHGQGSQWRPARGGDQPRNESRCRAQRRACRQLLSQAKNEPGGEASARFGTISSVCLSTEMSASGG